MSLYNFNKELGFTNANIKAVAFEGPDCCGKSTQVDLFIDDMKSSKYDVVLKFHFPLNTYEKNELKTNYKNLCNTIYSDKFMMMEQTDSWFEKLELALTANIDVNSRDKMDFMRILYYMLNGGKFDSQLMMNESNSSINSIIRNPNTEIWFNSNKLDPNNVTEVQCLEEYLSTRSMPRILIVFDRFIISGMIYNYFLPEAVINSYITSWKLHNNGVYKNEKEMKDILSNLKNAQAECSNNEINVFNSIIGTSLLNTATEASISTFCEPTMLWFVFKPSDVIYKAFLNDKERKSEEYDTNNLIRYSVNQIYNNICELGNKSDYLMNFKFSLETIDTDKLIYGASNTENSKKLISTLISSVYSFKNYKSLAIENSIIEFLNDSYHSNTKCIEKD